MNHLLINFLSIKESAYKIIAKIIPKKILTGTIPIIANGKFAKERLSIRLSPCLGKIKLVPKPILFIIITDK